MRIIVIALLFCVYKAITTALEMKRERERKEELERVRRAQAAQKIEQTRMRYEFKAEQNRAREQERKQAAMRRAQAIMAKEQERQRKEQERLAKEQEKQAAQIAKHEEEITKLGLRVATAESEIAFNREQRERLFPLLEAAELNRDACTKGSNEWQKHQRKVIALENQIHVVQKRIDKALMDRDFCNKKISA